VQQLESALETRLVIEQAKGFLVCRHGIGADEAFERLRTYARSHRVTVRQVASDVLAGRLGDRLVDPPT